MFQCAVCVTREFSLPLRDPHGRFEFLEGVNELVKECGAVEGEDLVFGRNRDPLGIPEREECGPKVPPARINEDGPPKIPQSTFLWPCTRALYCTAVGWILVANCLLCVSRLH